MSGKARSAAAKRQRQQQEEDEAAEPELGMTARRKVPLSLQCVVMWFHGTLVWAQLCNPQGVALFSFVRLPPHVPHPFAGVPVYDMSLTHAERLRAVGCGFKGKLVRLLSLGVGRHFEPQRNSRACHQMIQSNVRHMAAGLAAVVRDKVAKEAQELCAAGQCAAAVVPLQWAIDLGDLPSRALKAWLLADGREGVAKDEKAAFELAEEGARLGCHHCQGVMACGYFFGCGCEEDYARSLELARESAGMGSRYGQYTMARGLNAWCGRGRDHRDAAQAVAFYRLAAAQGLDAAQCELSIQLTFGVHVARDYAEALRLCELAATQGYADALFTLGDYHERAFGVARDIHAAIRLYKRAQAAGSTLAAARLQELGA